MCYITLESTSGTNIEGSGYWKMRVFEDNFFIESCFVLCTPMSPSRKYVYVRQASSLPPKAQWGFFKWKIQRYWSALLKVKDEENQPVIPVWEMQRLRVKLSALALRERNKWLLYVVLLEFFEGKKKVRLVHKWEVLTWEYLNCEQKDCREEQMDLTRRESRSPQAGTVGSEPPVQ